MNTYIFIFQNYKIEVQADTLGRAYATLERETVMKEEKLLTVECKRSR